VNHDERLLAHVRPQGWRNPEPAPLYDLVVIGGGTAGLVCAAGAAGLGARVAIVERHRLGGDCLNTGCVPSKSMLRAARAVHDARRAAGAGVSMTPQVNFAAVMESVRARRADLAPNDSAQRLTSIGAHVFLGQASFVGPARVIVEPAEAGPHDSGARSELKFRRAVIATGGRPAIPPIPGLATLRHLTSENVFELREQPRSLLVIGGGPIGCELAQAFALLGTAVTLVETAPRLLPREDRDAAGIVTRRLVADGVRVLAGASIRGLTQEGRHVSAALDTECVRADAVLVAVGRAPNTDGLKLEAAGVGMGERGVVVDDHLRTSNRRIFAAGDVCSSYQFTHAADAMARIVIQNALFHGHKRVSALVIPWATYTFPEVAHVGPAAEEAARLGADTVTVQLSDVDRAVIEAEPEGFLRIHHRQGRILAATLVAPHAGELIGQVASVMRRGGSLADFSSDIFPYPTFADVLKKAGDAYRRTRLTARAKALLGKYFALMRSF
jgi:pyruvate/2-oxoglutarate dehydrogenase complex dihydrolipoamide dehydrogenase (E3) component